MNEFTPRPVLRPVRPPAERQPVPRVPASPEDSQTPDYAQASRRALRRAEAVQLTHLISADIGHFMLKGLAFASQLFGLVTGEAVPFDWDPKIAGLRPDLDEKERLATEQLRAIWREKSLRRSVRQEQRTRRS